MNHEVLRIEHLSCEESGYYYLKHINLNIQSGEIVALYGLNGSGKTALIDTLFNKHKLHSGKIYYQNQLISPLTQHDAIKNGIHYISSLKSLNNMINAAGNLFLGVQKNKLFVESTLEDRFANEILIKYNAGFRAATPLTQLSSSQKYSLLVLKAIMRGASLIILDNVLSSLPGDKVDSLLSIIRQASSENISFMICDHKMGILSSIAHRTYVIQNGRICAEYEQNNYRICEISQSADRIMQPTIQMQSNVQPCFEYIPSNSVLSTSRIWANRGEIINICIESEHLQHSIDYCLINDCVISGQLFVEKVLVKPRIFHTYESFGIYYLPQTPPIFSIMSLYQNITAATKFNRHGYLFRNKNQERLFYSDVFYRYFFPESKLNEESQCNDISNLSKKKIALMRLLAASPKVIIINEPTNNLDQISSAELLHCISDIAALGVSIVILSQKTSEIVPICKRVYYLKDNTITCCEQNTSDDKINY